MTGTLSQAATIEALGRRLLPEVEFAVIRTPALRLVTIGCDLCDEEVDHADLERSKAVHATPIAPSALALDSLGHLPHLDALRPPAPAGWPRRGADAAGRARGPGVDGTGRQGQAVVYSGMLPLLEPIGTHLSEIEIGLDGGSPERKIVHRFRLV